MGNTVVLDSWAVIAFLEDEPAASQVEEIMLSAIREKTTLLMTVVNIGEVWYSIARANTPELADIAVNQVASLGIEFVSVDWELAHQAACFKARGEIAYADCFAGALAYIESAELVTGDPEFKQLEDEIEVTWV